MPKPIVSYILRPAYGVSAWAADDTRSRLTLCVRMDAERNGVGRTGSQRRRVVDTMALLGRFPRVPGGLADEGRPDPLALDGSRRAK